MNCLAIEEMGVGAGRRVLVDCGTNFPQGDYGVDVVHPDFRWLRSEPEALSGVFLTHGHEDHIGALPYLLREFQVPVWGPAHALALVKRRLAEHGFVLDSLDLREVETKCVYAVGPFQIEPVRVSHSIAQATALAIRTSAGIIVHSGDFKFDPEPADGEQTDEESLDRLGDEGVELLLSDSTNSDNANHSGSEGEVGRELERLVLGAQGRVFVALFASNIQRLISLGKVAQATGRRLCLMGRSLCQHVEIAMDLGLLKWPPELMLPADRARTYPRRELLVLASGTQGEAGSALSRIAQGTHRFIGIERGDTVIFSSRTIPGNERAVVASMSDLMRLGARVESRLTSNVHTSGHASIPEQRHLIQLLRPRCFLPLHGTLHHMTRHAELAASEGVKSTCVVENGQSVILENGTLRKSERVPSGLVHIELGGQALLESQLRERRELGRSGMLSIACVCDRHWALVGRPSVSSEGLPGFVEGPGEDAPGGSGWLALELEARWNGLQEGDATRTAESVRRLVRQWVQDRYGLRPVVTVHVMRSKQK
jgi:ribonuclease J